MAAGVRYAVDFVERIREECDFQNEASSLSTKAVPTTLRTLRVSTRRIKDENCSTVAGSFPLKNVDTGLPIHIR